VELNIVDDSALNEEQVETDTSGLDFSEPSIGERLVKTSPEEITMSLVEDGHQFDIGMLDAHKELSNASAIDGGVSIFNAKQKAVERKKQNIKNEHMGGEVIDLEQLDMELNSAGIWQPKDWKVEQGKGSLLYQQLQEAANGNPEEVERIQATMNDLSGLLSVQQELDNAYNMNQKMFDDASSMDIALDFISSLASPLVDYVSLGNVVEELVPTANQSGFYLASDVLNSVDEAFKKMTTDEKKQSIIDLLEKTHGRQTQFGLGENVLTNHWVTQTILNTLSEHREDGSGFLGMKVPTDIGVNAMEVLDLMWANDLAFLGGRLFRKIFGKASTKAPKMSNVGNVFDNMLLEKGITPKKPPRFNPELDTRSNTGSLLDTLAITDKKSVGKIVDDVPPEKIDDALEATGGTRTSVEERMRPNITGSIDPTSLPPSAHSPRLSKFMTNMEHNSNLSMLGFTEERGAVMSRFVDDFIAATKGYPHPSSSYIRPPTKGDTESLGTVIVRFGATPDGGFQDAESAIMLMNNLKAQGLPAYAVTSDKGIFVETEKTHVLSGKDYGKFNAVDGEPLTTGFSYAKRHLLPWSETVTGINEAIHPQRLASFAVDAGVSVKAELMKVAQPYIDLANKINRKQFNMVRDAIKVSEEQQKTISHTDLARLYPEMTDEGVAAYYSNRDFWEGIQLQRAGKKRRKLNRGGFKTIGVGEEAWFGKVLPIQPKVSTIKTNAEGHPLVKDIMESDTTIYGSQAFNKVTGEVVNISDEILSELYAQGGRVIKLHSPIREMDEDFSYLIADSLSDVQVRELPIFPNFGFEGYAGQRVYKDSYFKIYETGQTRRLNGQDVFGEEAIGIVATKAHAKKLEEYFRNKYPSKSFKVEQTRELDSAMNVSNDASGVDSFMRSRKDLPLAGKIGKDGEPIPAPLLDESEVFKRTLHGVAADKLKAAEEANTVRFMNQYSPFFKKDDTPFPSKITDDMWDNGKINKMIGKSGSSQFKEDAKTLHYNIAAMRAERLADGQRAFRAAIAKLGRNMGYADNIVASTASKALIETSKAAPFQYLRGVTSAMNISWGFAFQLPQNMLSATGVLTTQGLDGIGAMSDAGFLFRGMQLYGRGSEYDAMTKVLSWKLDVPADIASEFVKRAKTSGVIGNAGEVDNMLRHVSEAIALDRGVVSTALRPISKVASTTTGAVSNLVAKSIDATMLMFYSAAFRSQVQAFRAAGKSIGTDEFWELTRQQSRKLSQNQNSSSLISWERRNNLISTPMQFLQHMTKIAWDWTKTHGIALGVNIPYRKITGREIESIYSKGIADSWKKVGIYATFFGAGGYGATLMDYVHDELPVSIANPESEADKMILAFIQGGMVDSAFQGANFVFHGGKTGEQLLSISSRVSPFGIAETFGSMIKTLGMAIKTREFPIDLLETFGGASWSSVTNFSGIVKAIPYLLEPSTYENEEELFNAVSNLAYLSKSLGDMHLAYMMHRTGNAYGKMSGKVLGKADPYVAFGKIFGFDSTSVIHQRMDKQEKYFLGAEHRAIVKATTTELIKRFNTIVDPNRPETLKQFEQDKQRLLNDLAALSIPTSQIKSITSKLASHYIDVISKDKGFLNTLKKGTSLEIPIEEILEEWIRQPNVSQEDVDKVMPFIEAVKKQKMGTQEAAKNPPAIKKEVGLSSREKDIKAPPKMSKETKALYDNLSVEDQQYIASLSTEEMRNVVNGLASNFPPESNKKSRR
jgi:hypothetical protein